MASVSIRGIPVLGQSVYITMRTTVCWQCALAGSTRQPRRPCQRAGIPPYANSP